MAKGNSNKPATNLSAVESAVDDDLSQADLMLEPLPPPTLRQKIFLGVMILVILGWLAFLLALAVKP